MIPTLLRGALVALTLVSLRAHACVNDANAKRHAEQYYLLEAKGQSLKPILVTPASKAHLVESTRRVVENVRLNPSLENLNDIAAVLIRHGRQTEAVNLLVFIERKYPGRYETAANLGTAYELMGRNEDALKWILEGMKRNPDSHFGTEWLHVRILKAKLGRLSKAAAGGALPDLDFGTDAMPRRPVKMPLGNDAKPLSLYALGLALRYQLFERIAFVPAPDPMVAGLLLDWANLELLAGSLQSADVLYDAARRYGSVEGRLIALRKAHVKFLLSQPTADLVTRGDACELCLPQSP